MNNTYSFFSQAYWCESLSEELDIWYDNVEHEPENGINWEFEWEAMDSLGNDLKSKMSDKEQAEVEKTIKDYLLTASSDRDYG